jgi:hypothetical protein
LGDLAGAIANSRAHLCVSARRHSFGAAQHFAGAYQRGRAFARVASYNIEHLVDAIAKVHIAAPARPPHWLISERFAKPAVAGAVFWAAVRLYFRYPQNNVVFAQQLSQQLLRDGFNRAQIKPLFNYWASPQLSQLSLLQNSANFVCKIPFSDGVQSVSSS